jgi:YegS/Rv2252/BmrU family lipid kinase
MARSRKVQLILNGKAAGHDALQAAVARQRAAGHSIEVRVTLEKGDARQFVAEAGEVDLLIAAGGDGTVNEVVHGLMDLSTVARPVLGVVPLGTANDFAIGCGIPRDPEKALALCMEGEGIPVDVGKANEHWFLNAASIGFGAEVTATTPPELKRLLGPCRVHRDGCNSNDKSSSLSRKANLAGSRNHWQRPGGDRRQWASDGRRRPSRSPRTH